MTTIQPKDGGGSHSHAGGAGGRGRAAESAARRGPRGSVPVADRGKRSDAVGAADPESAARAVCLRLLDTAPRTRAELDEHLRRRGVPSEPAAQVLDRLADVGLIDDVAYAQAWVSTRQAGRGLGRRRLVDELRRKGVARETIDEAIEQVDTATERATARALVARRLPQLSGLSREKQLRRLAGVLARRGYPDGLVREVVTDAVLGGDDSS